MYWDINRALSYNCLFNFIVGARGVGKTYGAKKYVINAFLKRGEQFVYVRRYKEELKKIKNFFEDVGEEFIDHELEVKPPLFFIDGEIAGTAIPLSTSKIEKSTPFPHVKTIIFDEFILDIGYHKYLPDEVTNFLELYSTIARSRDVRVFFLSNALTVTNPYFIYFDLSLPYGSNIRAKDDILLEMVIDDDFTKMMQNTRFGKIIEGTPYSNYAINNTFLRDDKDYIEKKPSTAKFSFAFRHKGQIIGAWLDYGASLLYMSNDIDPSTKFIFSTTLEDHKPNTVLMKGKDNPFIKHFIRMYKFGNVRYENMQVKNFCKEIIKMTL